ncbi:MAG: flagellar basal body rod protein FlgB [Chloroflexi bacterium]|nr:flagellar basal body rod protein FlgB [Chloroflexota bacterium]
MTDPLLFDRALRTAASALDGLAAQQEMIGHNLSNVDTPGYKAQTVDFQSALRRALSSADEVELDTTHSSHLVSLDRRDRVQLLDRRGGSMRADGNNVDIDVELTQLTETGVEYQAVVQLVTKKLQLLKAVSTGR